MNNKKFTPIYDTDYIQKWYLNNIINDEIFFAGEVKSFMGLKIPEGWLPCDGRTISRNTYKKLFDAIGTQYGAGDGTATFEIPTIVDSDSVLGYKIIKY